MDNWLEIVIGVFLLGMVLYGHWRGLIRLAISMLALVITLVVVKFAMPYASGFIRQNTSVYEWLADRVESAFQIKTLEEELSDDPASKLILENPSVQRQLIENMDLPEEVKELLIENNNSEVYGLLGVNAFAEYVGNYLAGLLLNTLGFVLLFLAVYIALRLLAGALNLVAELPILSGINHLAGALLGGIHGLIFVWIFFLLSALFSKTEWSALVMDQIRQSPWLSLLYRYNLIARLILGIFKGMIG